MGASSGYRCLDGVRVLIFDDDDGIRLAERCLLEQYGAIGTIASLAARPGDVRGATP